MALCQRVDGLWSTNPKRPLRPGLIPVLWPPYFWNRKWSRPFNRVDRVVLSVTRTIPDTKDDNVAPQHTRSANTKRQHDQPYDNWLYSALLNFAQHILSFKFFSTTSIALRVTPIVFFLRDRTSEFMDSQVSPRTEMDSTLSDVTTAKPDAPNATLHQESTSLASLLSPHSWATNHYRSKKRREGATPWIGPDKLPARFSRTSNGIDEKWWQAKPRNLTTWRPGQTHKIHNKRHNNYGSLWRSKSTGQRRPTVSAEQMGLEGTSAFTDSSFSRHLQNPKILKGRQRPLEKALKSPLAAERP